MSLEQEAQARWHLDRAQSAMDADMLDEALTQVTQCLELDPCSPVGRTLDARIRLRQNHPAEALEALQAHDEHHPALRNTPAVAIPRAKALIRCGRDEQALGVLEDLLRSHPDIVAAHRMVIAICLKRGLTTRAVTHLEELLSLQPGDQRSLRMLAQVLAETSPDAGLRVFAGRQPGGQPDAAMQLQLARLYRQAGRERDAEELYRQLLPEHPCDQSLWIEAGELADAMGADELAVKRLTAAWRMGPDRRALRLLAVVHMRAGRFANAGRCWWRLARWDDKDVEAWAGLAVCAALGLRKRASERASLIVRALADRAERRELLAGLWVHAEMGVAILDARGAGAASDSAESSVVAEALGQSAEALRQHAAKHPRRADTHFHLAVCEQALGNAEAAKASIEAALRINPRYAAAQQLAESLGEVA